MYEFKSGFGTAALTAIETLWEALDEDGSRPFEAAQSRAKFVEWTLGRGLPFCWDSVEDGEDNVPVSRIQHLTQTLLHL